MHPSTQSPHASSSSTQRKNTRRKRYSRTPITGHTKHRHSNSTTRQSRRRRYSRKKARYHTDIHCPAGYRISKELNGVSCVADGYEQRAKEFDEEWHKLDQRGEYYIALGTGTARIYKPKYGCSSKPYRLELLWRKYVGADTIHCEVGIGGYYRYLCLGKIKHVGEPKIDSKRPQPTHKTNYLLNQGDTIFTFEYFLDASNTVCGLYPPRQLQLTNLCLDSYEDVTTCFNYVKANTNAWYVLDLLYSRESVDMKAMDMEYFRNRNRKA